MDLLMKHEKEYIKTRNGSKFSLSKNRSVIKVGGVGNECAVKEKFV